MSCIRVGARWRCSWMGQRVSTADLACREYLSASEAARVFGRGKKFWSERAQFEDVDWYWANSGGRFRKRLISVDSIRAFLAGECRRRRDARRVDIRRETDRFRAMLKS